MFVPKTFKPLQQTSASQPTQGGFVPKTFVPEKKTIGGFLGNVGKSAINTGLGIGSAVINTVNPNMEKNTIANIGRVGVGAAQLLDPTQVLGTGQEQTARNVGQFYKDRYGGFENIKNTLYNDPVGAALDVSAVVGGVGGLAKGAAGLSTRGASSVSLASNAAKVGKFGSGLTRAAEVVDPFMLAGKGITKVGKYVAGDAPEVLRTASNDVLTKGYGQPGKLEDISGVAGRPVGKLINDYKVYDRNPETIGSAITSASDAYDSLLRSAGSPISTKKLLESLDIQIKKLDNESLLSETAASQRDALITRRSNLEKYLSKNNAVPLNFSPETAVKMKSNIYKDVKPASFNPSYAGSGSQMAAKDAYRQLISSIDDSAPGTRQLGRDQSALMQLQDVAETAMQRGKAKQGFGVGDSARIIAGGSAYGLPGAVATYAVGKIANSPLGTELRSKAYGTLASAVEAGSPGVERVGNILSKSYSAGKGASRISSFLLSPRQKEDPTELQSQSQRQTQKVTPYPKIITPPVKPSYNFKQKVIKNPFKKEQGGGNPFGAVHSAYKRFGNTVADVADNPQNTFRQAIDRVPGGQMVRQMILPPKAEKDELVRLLHTPYRTASPEDQRRIADMALNQSMMVGSVSPSRVPRIPKPTQGEMAGFIDYVRLKQPFSHQAELAASRIAEKYKLLNKTPKSTRGLANIFDRTLSKLNFR